VSETPNVVALKARVENENVVELLEKALGWAKSGELIGVAMALTYRGMDGSSWYAISPGTNPAVLVGHLERIKYDLVRRTLGNSDEGDV